VNVQGGGDEPIVEPAPNTLEGVALVDDPTDSVSSRLDDVALQWLCEKHRIPYKDTRLPSRNDKALTSRGVYCLQSLYVHCWMRASFQQFYAWGPLDL